MKKKLLSILLATLLLLTCIPLGAVSISAEESVYNGLIYEINSWVGEVTITGWTRDVPANLVIPDTIEGYPVTTLNFSAENEYYPYFTSVTIPDSVIAIWYNDFYSALPSGNSLTTINVSENNSYYCDVDGVLFDKDKMYLIQYPAGKEETSYTIPNSVLHIEPLAFSGCTSLTEVTIPNRVRNIGGWAFSGCTSLAELTIPDSVTDIGWGAFQGCWNLSEMTLPNGITTISEYMFSYCGLTAVTIPDSVTTIEDRAFENCALTAVTIPDSVTTIEDSAFEGCNLTSVVIPDSVTTIEGSVFRGCSSLTDVTIGSGITSIGYGMFEDCRSLAFVTIPQGITTIESNAFYNCTSLIAVTIPDGVTTIGSGAFSDCYNLAAVTIPSSISAIEYSAFDGCSSLADVYYGGTEEDRANIALASYNEPLLNATWHYGKAPTWDMEVPAGLLYEIADGEVTITGYTDELPADLIIPNTIAEYPVTCIEENAFTRCEWLTSVSIPDNLTSINDAFQRCWLDAVTVSENNPNYCDIDGVLFNKNKTELIKYPARKRATAYSIPDSVTTVDDYAFYCCTHLSEITIPDGVTTIGNYAFYECHELTSVTIPDSVISIGERAFYYCSSLASVTIGNHVAFLGRYAFYECHSLTSVVIPNSITSIEDGVFRYCSSLAKITIPNSVTSIGECAFESCRFTSVMIPNSVISLDKYAFRGCSSLNSITIGRSVTTIEENAFKSCTSLTDVYYAGNIQDRTTLNIDSYNSDLTNATWHYADDPISDHVDHSVMDTAKGNGLAFRFELSAKGVVRDAGNVMDLSNATVNYLGSDCKLIAMGAVLTNNAEVGATAFTLEDVNGGDVLNIPTVYLQEADEDSCAFATRIINIPITQLTCTIYARPYYIVEVDGEKITVYGDVDSATCAEYM